MKRSKFQSLDDALLASERVHSRSSVSEIAKVLRYVGNGALHESLFGLGQLRPVIEWMENGVPFPKIARLVWSITLSSPRYHVRCWAYFNRYIEPMRGEVETLTEAMSASKRITESSNRTEIANVLRYAGDGALAEMLLVNQNLDPVIALMRAGVPFTTMVMAIWIKVRREGTPVGTIRSWSFLEDEAGRMSQTQTVPSMCARDRNPNGRRPL